MLAWKLKLAFSAPLFDLKSSMRCTREHHMVQRAMRVRWRSTLRCHNGKVAWLPWELKWALSARRAPPRFLVACAAWVTRGACARLYGKACIVRDGEVALLGRKQK